MQFKHGDAETAVRSYDMPPTLRPRPHTPGRVGLRLWRRATLARDGDPLIPGLRDLLRCTDLDVWQPLRWALGVLALGIVMQNERCVSYIVTSTLNWCTVMPGRVANKTSSSSCRESLAIAARSPDRIVFNRGGPELLDP